MSAARPQEACPDPPVGEAIAGHHDLPQHLGPALRRLRTLRGLSQTRLAELCQLTPPMISNYERGANLPSLVSLQRLLNALEVSVRELGETLAAVRGEVPPLLEFGAENHLDQVMHRYALAFQDRPMQRGALLRTLVAVGEALLDAMQEEPQNVAPLTSAPEVRPRTGLHE
ncbi:MAG: helix-turn-helix transcriptional regulator [Acidobacteriota bacterium]